MKDLVEKLTSNSLLEGKRLLDEKLKNLVAEKLNQIKMRVTAELYEEIGAELEFVVDDLNEGNILRMGRTKMVRVRIRKGKVQRRVKKSAVPGYTIRGGKMIRMSAIERRHRKMAARRSKFKRRAKMKQSLRKRRMSLRRRTAMGL